MYLLIRILSSVILRPLTIFLCLVDALGTLWSLPYTSSLVSIQIFSDFVLIVISVVPVRFLIRSNFGTLSLVFSMVIYGIGAGIEGFSTTNVFILESIIITFHLFWIALICSTKRGQLQGGL